MSRQPNLMPVPDKSLLLIPERFILGMTDPSLRPALSKGLALAVEHAWIARNFIVWHKPNPMPESVRDRFSCTWEPVFYFAKSQKVWFDLDAVRRPFSGGTATPSRKYADATIFSEQNSQTAMGQRREYPSPARAKTADEGLFKPTTKIPAEISESMGSPRAREHRDKTRYEDKFKPPGAGRNPPEPGVEGPFLPLGANPGDFFIDGDDDWWEIATQARSETARFRGRPDYVQVSGTTYKVSRDCPVHGHLSLTGTPNTVSGDGQPEASEHDSASNANDRDQALGCESPSIHSHAPQKEAPGSARGSNPDGTDGNKTSATLPDTPTEVQRHHGTEGTPKEGVPYGLDSLPQQYAHVAIDHSSETSKTAPSLATIPSCKPSAETAYGIEHRQDLRASVEPHASKPLSNSEADKSASSGESESPSRISDTQSLEAAESPCRQDNTPKCTCQVATTEHFATFPDELARRMILVGCPEWVCRKCGMARVRISRQQKDYHYLRTDTGKPRNVALLEKGGKSALPSGQEHGRQYKEGYVNVHETTGWTTCSCVDEEGKHPGFRPGVVLDPFAGRGTVGIIAKRYGRESILVEIKEEYCQMIEANLAAEPEPLRMEE